MNILVTGGSGFIGTNLVTDLLKKGHEVSIYDKNISTPYPELSLVADIRNRDRLNKALHGIDVIYHLAAEHRDDVKPVSLYYDVNVKGAENLVQAADNNNVRRIIFTSSVAVYGLNAGEPSEESTPNPFNEYSKSKLQSEEVFNNWVRRKKDRSLVIVRPVVIFGEKNRGNVYELLRQIASNRFLMIGTGKNKKSMGYVRNISEFLTTFAKSAPGTQVYNYADKPDLTVNALVNTVLKVLGKNPTRQLRIPYPIGLFGGYLSDILAKITGRTYPISSIRIKKFVADTTVSAEKLKGTGFFAPYSLAEGLERMILSEFGTTKDRER